MYKENIMKLEERMEKYLSEGKNPQLESKFKKIKAMGNNITKFRNMVEEIGVMLTKMFDEFEGWDDYHQFDTEIEELVRKSSDLEYDLKDIKYPKLFK
jgi:hypothetical protein